MEEATATGNYYTLNHVALITGLTTRTLRNYLSMGLLEGEKINGLWHFSPSKVDAFIRHPKVYPSVEAKNNAIVFDYLMDTKKQEHEMCIILDLPGVDRKNAAEFFCYQISNGNYNNVRFSFNSIQGTPRVILKGYPDDIMDLVKDYYQKHLL